MLVYPACASWLNTLTEGGNSLTVSNNSADNPSPVAAFKSRIISAVLSSTVNPWLVVFNPSTSSSAKTGLLTVAPVSVPARECSRDQSRDASKACITPAFNSVGASPSMGLLKICIVSSTNLVAD